MAKMPIKTPIHIKIIFFDKTAAAKTLSIENAISVGVSHFRLNNYHKSLTINKILRGKTSLDKRNNRTSIHFNDIRKHKFIYNNAYIFFKKGQ